MPQKVLCSPTLEEKFPANTFTCITVQQRVLYYTVHFARKVQERKLFYFISFRFCNECGIDWHLSDVAYLFHAFFCMS